LFSSVVNLELIFVLLVVICDCNELKSVVSLLVKLVINVVKLVLLLTTKLFKFNTSAFILLLSEIWVFLLVVIWDYKSEISDVSLDDKLLIWVCKLVLLDDTVDDNVFILPLIILISVVSLDIWFVKLTFKLL